MNTRALVSFCSTLALSSVALLAQAQAQATVAQVFNGEMLGSSLGYFESVAGVAQASDGDTHSYRVQGCEVTATAAGGKVSALRLALSPTCKADLSSFIGTFAPPGNEPLTFGALNRSTGGPMAFYADCLDLCGNAYDPSVYALWEGPHAVNFTQVMLEVVLAGDQAVNAAYSWRDAISKAKGDDFVVDTRFNCERTFDPAAMHHFQGVEVTAVTIGSGLSTPGC